MNLKNRKRLDREARRTLDERIAWWREARYGMFICHGLYSLYGQMCWNPLANTGFPFRKCRAFCKDAMAQYRPRPNSPEAWARLAVEAGMKYAVLTTKHYEGFCLWDSQVNEFTAVNSGARRDLVREYVEACRRHKLRIGFYFSWADAMYEGFVLGPKKNPAAWRRYVDATHAQVRELMTQYGQVDILWYDTLDLDRIQPLKVWELEEEVRRLQPGIIINSRCGWHGDFDTPENEIRPSNRDWETCDVLTQWGYCPWDRQLREPPRIMKDLVMCAGQNGNYLLNISPKASGVVPDDEAGALRPVGRWLKRYGESIYGTRGGGRKIHQGYVTVNEAAHKMYLHVFPQCWLDRVLFTRYAVIITGAYLLQTGQRVRVQRFKNSGYLFTGLPARPPDPLDNVIVAEFRGDWQPLKIDYIPPVDVFRRYCVD